MLFCSSCVLQARFVYIVQLKVHPFGLVTFGNIIQWITFYFLEDSEYVLKCAGFQRWSRM